MRPTFYRQLPALPLTGNGKVDRDALPRPDILTHSTENTAPLPGQIATLWAAILQLDHVSETDNFFDSGGTSLQLLASAPRCSRNSAARSPSSGSSSTPPRVRSPSVSRNSMSLPVSKQPQPQPQQTASGSPSPEPERSGAPHERNEHPAAGTQS